MNESPKPIIALLTDFGADSYYVAQMKGVLLGMNPQVTIVDITHSISPQNIRQAANVLNDCVPSFPDGTIFVTVVDPGVGTDRNILCVEYDERVFVGPDNGLLSVLLNGKTDFRIRKVHESLMETSRSNTFHGRDVMAPVAGRLSLLFAEESVSVDDLLVETGRLELFDVPSPSISENQIFGEFVYADSFGNLISNVSATLLANVSLTNCVVHFGDETINSIDSNYAAKKRGQPLALIGSNGCLEVAVNGESAMKKFGDLTGQPIRLHY